MISGFTDDRPCDVRPSDENAAVLENIIGTVPRRQSRDIGSTMATTMSQDAESRRLQRLGTRWFTSVGQQRCWRTAALRRRRGEGLDSARSWLHHHTFPHEHTSSSLTSHCADSALVPIPIAPRIDCSRRSSTEQASLCCPRSV